MKSRFSMFDLIAAIVILLIGFGGLMPMFQFRLRHGDNRIKCTSNLRQIGLAMKMYANEETRTQAFPRTRYIDGAPPTFYTGANATNPFAEDGPKPNDVTAALFLILRTQDITSDVFVCPSSDSDWFIPERGKGIKDYSNFHSAKELSYSLANPYANKSAVENGFQFNDSMSADFALMADIGTTASLVNQVQPTDLSDKQRAANSPNHDRDGQNVLYADGHCDWVTTVFQGAQNDNIYTSGAIANDGKLLPPDPLGSPTCMNDSVILPLWDEKILGTPHVDRSPPLSFYLPDMITVIRWAIGIITCSLAGYMVYRAFHPYKLKPNTTI